MLWLVSFLLSLLALTTAQDINNASAVFKYDGDDHTSFVFALSAEKSTGDLYFFLSAPSGNAWVGVGIGDEMKGSLFMIAYPDSSGKKVTISPRIADGHSEPTYQSNIKIDKIEGGGLIAANTVNGERDEKVIRADGVCRGCATWKGGNLNYANKKQPFIFAVGPPFPEIESDSQSAGLSRHMFYGHFTMDMTQASIEQGASIPTYLRYTTQDASEATGTKMDNDPAPRIHGLVMSLVFIVLFPLGSLVLRVWHKVKGHAAVQIVALILFLMAFAGGAVVSKQYNRSKHFNSAHQVIGILLLLAFLGQLVLGVLNHRIFTRENRKTIMGTLHKFLGPTICLIGIINGYVGLSFAGAAWLSIPYTIIIVLFAGAYSCIRGGTWFYRRRHGRSKNTGPEGYQYPQFGNTAYGAQPGGYNPPPYAQQDVPLARFESSQSVPRMDDTPAQPRPMV